MRDGPASVRGLAFPDRPSMKQTADGSFAENTNSQFYMWETDNQTDMPDFENDIIASTSEYSYS